MYSAKVYDLTPGVQYCYALALIAVCMHRKCRLLWPKSFVRWVLPTRVSLGSVNSFFSYAGLVKQGRKLKKNTAAVLQVVPVVVEPLCVVEHDGYLASLVVRRRRPQIAAQRHPQRYRAASSLLARRPRSGSIRLGFPSGVGKCDKKII